MFFRIRQFHILIDKIHIFNDLSINIMRRKTGCLNRHLKRMNPFNHLMDKFRLRQWFAA